MLIADTHAWTWWVTRNRLLSKRAAAALDQEPEVGLSAISLWEVAMLVAVGRLRLDREPLVWMKQALARPTIALLQLTPEIAALSAVVEGLHGDPADRMIVASAIHYDAVLVTKDRRLRDLKAVRTLW